jgi:hypothetical protein
MASTPWPNRELGIASVFALIDIIEADRTPGSSHPSAWDQTNVVEMQAAAAKAKIDWGYVYGVLKSVLDEGAESCIGRRVFQQFEKRQ